MLQEKQIEISHIIQLLEIAPTLPGGVIKSAVLKSLVAVALYNAVESIICVCLDIIHDHAAGHDFMHLSDKMQEVWTQCYFIKSKQDNIRLVIIGATEGSLRLPPADKMRKITKPFSGNLDGIKVREVLGRYGIRLERSPPLDSLREIKETRNRLGHGEIMFKEARRNMTVDEVKANVDAVFEALRFISGRVDSFLEKREYLAPACRTL